MCQFCGPAILFRPSDFFKGEPKGMSEAVSCRSVLLLNSRTGGVGGRNGITSNYAPYLLGVGFELTFNTRGRLHA